MEVVLIPLLAITTLLLVLWIGLWIK